MVRGLLYRGERHERPAEPAGRDRQQPRQRRPQRLQEGHGHPEGISRDAHPADERRWGLHDSPSAPWTRRPIVGTVGTGVETNEVYTNFTQGALKQTENDFDLALEGKGFLTVQTPQGERLTRNGAFLVNSDGYLVTKSGDFVLGENGPHQAEEEQLRHRRGRRPSGRTPPSPRTTSAWCPRRKTSGRTSRRSTVCKIVDVTRERYMQKQGNSYWRTTDESGDGADRGHRCRPKVRQGYPGGRERQCRPGDGGDDRSERAYDANQKTIQTEDSLIGKAVE